MRRALLAAGAVLIFAAPALADELTVDKKTVTTTTTTRAPEDIDRTVSTVVIAPTPPPPPRVEVRPPLPGPGAVWIPGHWRWSRGEQRYAWVRGRYAAPPRARAAWLAGHFVQRPDGWVWIGGRWD